MGIAQRLAARAPRELWLRPITEIWETEHRLLHALGRARPPAAVQWMVTRSCDLHCGHCYAEAGHKTRDELSTNDAKRLVIDATADMGCPLLVLAGGELWLRRDIEELIEHAVARGLEWAMHTHGGHVPKHRELLRRHPPALAAISLDGDRELHDGFRGKTGSHAAALAAVSVLREGFARFRQGGDPICSDTSECWLQTRNGVRIAESAFGSIARPRPKLVDFVPPKLIALSHRTLAARQSNDGFASTLTRKAITATAVGLAVLGACTLPRDSSEPAATDASTDKEDSATQPTTSIESKGAPTPATEWPASLDSSGQHAYGAWTDMHGLWKSSTLPELLAWESGGPVPQIAVPRSEPGVDESLLAAFEEELARHVQRGFGQGNLADLLGLLEAAERAALFDAAFAAHLWRAAEQIPVTKDAEPRARLYDRLARHHHVVLALVASTGTLGPITQRPWLKKSAPPPDWREQQIPVGFEQTARGLLAAGVSGPWDSVGVSVRFETDGTAPTLHRNGSSSAAPVRQAFRWGRLDVLGFAADTRVLLASGIVIDVPVGAVLTHASLAGLMSASTRGQLDALIDQALGADRQALGELEVLLPIACAQLRSRLATSPDEPGAPALRTMLVGYEE
jgi:hypothetical protein